MAPVNDESAKRLGLKSGLGLALAYCALGSLGLLLSVPPAEASPLFPAAGFALVCALIWGAPAMAIAWIGSFTLNLTQMAIGGTLAPAPLASAAVVAAGVSLQAWVGARLVRAADRHSWRALDNEGAILHFLWRGGVVACLVSASVGVTALMVAGVVPPDAWLFSWWNWYSGDLLGVVIFAPLTLLVLCRHDPLWRERRWRLGVPIVLTLVLAMMAFAASMHSEQQRDRDRLARDGEDLARLIGNRLIAQREILSSLRHFAEATPEFTYQQFETFTRISLSYNPDIFALSFNDLVAGKDLAAYEQRMRRLSPVSDYRVTELDAQGRLVPVQPRDFHVAVRYITPLDANLPALGYDISSEPLRRQAVDRARQGDDMAVTAPLQLLQEGSTRRGVLALLPVDWQVGGNARSAMRPSGFAVAVVKVDQLLEIATRGHVPKGLVFAVSDPSVPSGAGTFYASGPFPPGGRELRWSAPLVLGDRLWQLEVRALEPYMAQHRSWMAWAVGVVGLMFAALLQIFLLGVTGRSAIIRRQNETLLANQAELLLADTVVKNTGEAVVVVNPEGQVLSVNPAYTRITGYRFDDVRLRSHKRLAGAGLPEQGERAMWMALAERGQWQGESQLQRKDGRPLLAWWTITAISDEVGAPSLYVCTFSDITERKQAQAQIEFLAYHDALTSLPNRVMGRERALDAIGKARRQGGKVAVLFMDLDHFKLVNDTYGHSVGDQLLQQVAIRLRSQLRGEDTLCRLSGDEFMVILEAVESSAQVVLVCEKILARLAEPMELDGHSLQVSMTIGVAMFPADGEDPESLLRNADTALFQAKQAGRNTYRLFDAYMNADVVRFVTIRDELQRALQESEFELYYQPQIDLADGSVAAVEALLRWNSPRRGLVMPGDFITVAEESGLIGPLGDWVLREACRQMAQWRELGIAMTTMTVNVSAVQLRKPGFDQVLAQALVQYGLPAHCLELELTESILIQDRSNTLVLLDQLRVSGVGLSIDDFGTGYSSMAYLKRLKVSKLKIDRSFSADVATDPDAAAIAMAIVSMARGLGLRTVAEGVETAQAEAALRAMGCDHVQGYLHARPMPAAQFRAWYEQRMMNPSAASVAAE